MCRAKPDDASHGARRYGIAADLNWSPWPVDTSLDSAARMIDTSRSGAAASQRLAVASHFVYAGRVGGAEHMLYNLLRGLAGNGLGLDVLCSARGNLDPGFLAEMEAAPGVRVLERGGAGPRFIAEQRACLDGDLRTDAILFPNYYIPPYVPSRLGRVATVLHDLQYKHFPQNFSLKKRAWLNAAQSFSVRRADRLIVISDFVGRDVLRWFGDRLAGKLSVIPNAISWDRFGPDIANEVRPMEQPYVLSVAAQYPHKNLEVLVRAFAVVAKLRPELQLVLCGQDYRSLHGVAAGRGGLAPMAEALGVPGRVHLTGYIDDAALGHWYRHASLFAFPSIFEGFGMPAVEALGFGLPTLTTDRTALPETTLGLAQYVKDPASAEEWADRMDTMLRDPERYRPAPADVARLRAHYSPARIGQLYRAACLD
jgi:glycosyltransferase involved in cell wall biosynthesis